MIKISLKDGVVKEFDSGVTAMEVAKNLGMGLYKAACVCKIDGVVADLRTPLTKDCALEILTFDEATSALDIDTEQKVLQNLAEWGKNRICIFTTHRTSVFEVCNRAYIVSGADCTPVM